MKTNKKQTSLNFVMKTLVQAVTVGLLMTASTQVMADGRSAIDKVTDNLGTDIKRFQTIGDLEIYQAAKEGKVTMTMMLDMSGSMWECLTNTSEPKADKNRYGIEVYKMTDTAGNLVKTVKDEYGNPVDVSEGFKVVHAYCDGGKSRNRLSELKHAVMTLFADGTALDPSYKVGIGTFPTFSSDTPRIMTPAKELTIDHRYRILRDIAGLNPNGGTPSAMAIAEAGAYMLGKTTTVFKENAQKKTGFVAKVVLDKESGVGGDAGYIVGRQCTDYRIGTVTSEGISHKMNVQTVNMIQALLHVGGTTSDGYSKQTRQVLKDNTWVTCGLVSDNAIGDVRYMDFQKYGLNEQNSPLRVFGTATKNGLGLDLSYMGHFTHAYDMATGTQYEVAGNKFINATVNQLYNNKYVPFIRGILLGEKIEFLEEVDNYNDGGKNPRVSKSGFGVAGAGTKSEDLRTYASPLSKDDKTCDGSGIFFLTDGEPNSATDHLPMMARSLGYTEQTNSAITEKFKTMSGKKMDLPDKIVLKNILNPNFGVAGTQFSNSRYVAVPNPQAGVLYENSGWAEIGAYAAILSNPKTNPAGKAILTATVGFGPTFNKEQATIIPGGYTDADGRKFDVVECGKYSTIDAQNLCKLGERGYGYGQGGFTATSTSEGVATAIKNFIGNLNQNISTQPAGTIAVPKDPLSVSNIQPYAYLPMLEPKVDQPNALWRGNLKKYHTLNGTLYGKGGTTRLYVKVSDLPPPPRGSRPQATAENQNYPSQFNPNTRDIWQNDDEGTNGAAIDIGGTYRRIKDISKQDDGLTSRSVYIENYKNYRKGVPLSYVQREVIKVGIEDGKMVGFDQLKAPYTVADKVYLLNYLGVNIPTESGSMPDDEVALKVAFEKAISEKRFNRTLLGAVLHSVPVLATYRGEFEADGTVITDEVKRQDHLLYGSMDGALHMVEASTGKETFAFVPRAMFEDTDQRAAFLPNAKGKIGQPKFGVDAPWTTHAEYVYDFAKKPAEVRAQKMYAFGGLRMGGNGIYGLDITDRTKPVLNFGITHGLAGFERMGQIWAKPTIAKIKTGPRPRDVKDVVIFGGGYDMCYEHPLFKLGATESVMTVQTGSLTGEQAISPEDARCTKAQAIGNAVYMVDAKNGDMIARWQLGEGSDDRQYMKHSVVGEVATLDSNNNGAIDHLYFADLGGQVFRVDLKEQATGSDITRRVVRVFDANGDSESAASSHINYRFYERPLISFHDDETSGKRFAVINIASGDRSSPVHTHRTLQDTNRIYGFFDRDLSTRKLDMAGANLDRMLSRNITADNLVKVNPVDVERGKSTKVNEILTKLKGTVASTDPAKKENQGWYYQMNRFDGRVNVSGLKAMGPGTVMGSIYYASVYSPSYEYVQAQECTARVSGGTERQLYCLPWGICHDEKTKEPTTKNGVLGYIKAGPGIQELAVGSVTATVGKSGKLKALLGHETLKENSTSAGSTQNGSADNPTSALIRLPKETIGQVTTGEGGDVYSDRDKTGLEFFLSVQRWYDLQNENQSN